MWKDALKYLLTSQGDYRLHSPFVYDFFQKVIRGKASTEGELAAGIRQKMLTDNTLIAYQDMGAGSRTGEGKEVSSLVRELAKKASRRRNEGEFLLRLFRFCQPQKALELGTHLGISSIYQKMGWPQADLITVEGIPCLAQIAAANFSTAGVQIPIHLDNFDAALQELVYSKKDKWDYVFIDGNHQYEATIDYFEGILPYMKEGGLILLDDIYWSEGMKRAWAKIARHPDVSVSLDVFRFGLCFIKRPQAKEHFSLRSIKLLF